MTRSTQESGSPDATAAKRGARRGVPGGAVDAGRAFVALALVASMARAAQADAASAPDAAPAPTGAAPAATSPAATAPAAAPTPSPAASNAATKGIAILDTASSWDNLSELFLSATPAAPFSEGSVFVIRGNLRNDSGASVRYVVLRYELLDETGNVVADAEGFNRRAESMRPDEEGVVHADKVEPLAAGAVDGYRMVFFHDEVPKFASRRVRVVEVHGGDAGVAAVGGAAK